MRSGCPDHLKESAVVLMLLLKINARLQAPIAMKNNLMSCSLAETSINTTPRWAGGWLTHPPVISLQPQSLPIIVHDTRSDLTEPVALTSSEVLFAGENGVVLNYPLLAKDRKTANATQGSSTKGQLSAAKSSKENRARL